MTNISQLQEFPIKKFPSSISRKKSNISHQISPAKKQQIIYQLHGYQFFIYPIKFPGEIYHHINRSYMGVSKNNGIPKWMVYNGKLIKMDDLGVPLFLETPIYPPSENKKKKTSKSCSTRVTCPTAWVFPAAALATSIEQ